MRIFSQTNSKLFLILVFFLFLKSLSAQDLNQKLSLKMKHVSIGAVLTEISKLTQVHFSYSSQLVHTEKIITLKAKNKTLKDILEEVLVQNGIQYTLLENQFVLKTIDNESHRKGKEMLFTISGFIKDKSNAEALIGGSVYAKGSLLGTTSNGYGFYSLSLKEGSYDLIFSFVGYKNISRHIDLQADKKINMDLEEENLSMVPVEIKTNNEESSIKENQLSQMHLSQKTISQMHGFVGEFDIIKSLQAIPGIKSYGDASSLFYVRGGNSDENLILIDEAPIYNPSHLFGFFTAIAPDAIKDIETYKGDFPANFGGRISSVVDVKTKEGNMKKLGLSGSLSPYTSNLTVEGPIKKEACSFFITGRTSNLNWLNNIDVIDKSLKLNFFDLNAKVNMKLNTNNHIFFSGYYGEDNFTNYYSTSYRTFGISWDNLLGTLRWNHIFNDKLFSNTTLYSSRYRFYLYTSKEKNDYWISSISNVTLKTDFTYYLNPQNTIKAGIELSTHASNPGNIHYSETNIQNSITDIPTYTSRELDFYISNEQKLSKKLSLRYGLRVPIWQNVGPTTLYYFDGYYNVIDTQWVVKNAVASTFYSVEPRLNLKYLLNATTVLKASYCRSTQFIHLLSNSTSPFTSLEVWVPSGNNIQPQNSNQFALGYFKEVGKAKYIFSAEAYYKKCDHQIDYKDHANMLYNPLIEGELRFGNAYAYGLELMLRKTEGKFSGWLGYTYSRAFRQIQGINNNEEFPSNYDCPNDICCNISYNAGKKWSFSVNWIYQTGRAITTPVSFYQYNGYSVPIYGSKNNDRLNDYHRMDLAITYKINKVERKVQHVLIFTVFNVYGRANSISLNFNKIVSDENTIVVPSNLLDNNNIITSKLSLVGIIPSITYSFKF